MIVPSVVIHIPLYHSDDNTIGIVALILEAIQVIVLIVSIFPTEAGKRFVKGVLTYESMDYQVGKDQ